MNAPFHAKRNTCGIFLSPLCVWWMTNEDSSADSSIQTLHIAQKQQNFLIHRLLFLFEAPTDLHLLLKPEVRRGRPELVGLRPEFVDESAVSVNGHVMK